MMQNAIISNEGEVHPAQHRKAVQHRSRRRAQQKKYHVLWVNLSFIAFLPPVSVQAGLLKIFF